MAPSADPLTVTISSTAWHAALDPDASPQIRKLAEREGWPTPRERVRGGGVEYVYVLSPNQVSKMIDHLGSAALRLMNSGPEGRPKGIACRAAARRLSIQLERLKY